MIYQYLGPQVSLGLDAIIKGDIDETRDALWLQQGAQRYSTIPGNPNPPLKLGFSIFDFQEFALNFLTV